MSEKPRSFQENIGAWYRGVKEEREQLNQRIAALESELASAGHEKSNLNDELYRVRTTQQASAHALDRVRQYMGLDLIEGEHPSDTAGRIESELAATKRECDGLREALTPSVLTKQAYSAEFVFTTPHGSTVFVPWATVKEIMKEISDRAEQALAASDATEGGA